MPRASIGLPVYNGERFLEEAIASILAQTFEDFELIISDNASTDRTWDICESYAARDRRIRYYRNEVNLGAGRNFNFVFEVSSGEYFKWAAHDDVCAPRFLEKCIAILDREPSVVLCYPELIDIDDQGRPLEARDVAWIKYSSHVSRTERGSSIKPHLRFRNLIKTDYFVEEVFGVIRSEVLRKTKLILNYTDSDRTLVAELGLYGRFHEVPEPLFYHRIHSGMSTKVYQNWEERTVWFDPALAGRPLFPMCKQFLEYIKVILRVPLARHVRARCSVSMLSWLWHKWPFLLVELIKGVNHNLHKLGNLVCGRRRDSHKRMIESNTPQLV